MSLLVYLLLKCFFLNEIARAILFYIERTYTIDIYRAIHLVAFIFSYILFKIHIYILPGTNIEVAHTNNFFVHFTIIIITTSLSSSFRGK